MGTYLINYLLLLFLNGIFFLSLGRPERVWAAEPQPVCVKVESAEYRLATRKPASPGKVKSQSVKRSSHDKGKSQKPAKKVPKKRIKNRNPSSAIPKKLEKAEKPEKQVLAKYTPLYWSGEREGAWILVNNVSGVRIWVRRSSVSTRLKCVTVRVAKSNLREGPGLHFPVAEVAQKGTGYLDLGSEDGWIHVKSARGKESWMNLDHTWRPVSLFQMKFQEEKVGRGDNEF